MRPRLPAWAWIVTAALLVALSGATLAAEDDQVRLEVKVTAEDTGKPVAYASVYVKFKEERTFWKDKKHSWNAKTNPDGFVEFPAMPAGSVLVQVIAKGWKTYGKFYDLEGPKQTLEIKLERPKKWY